ncbi:MAG: glycosyltransferase [Actinomycetales bacterium]|nr:glycosyltransferase [Actinomycetales bacterium]
MDYLVVIPAGLIFLISLINFLTIRTPDEIIQIGDAISVVVPMRNEAPNVAELVNSLRTQQNLTNVEFLFLDDNSEDGTLTLLHQHTTGLSNFHVLSGSTLPQGWIGKTWALQQLYEKSSGEIIVSIDADVRLVPDAICRAVRLLKRTQLDFLSPYPAQLAHTWSEKLIQPLLQWSWMSTVILRFAEKSSRTSMVVANGQFFIVRRAALAQVGGYHCVSNKVLDDVELARALVKQGSHGCVANGAAIASTRMYSSWNQIQSGYGKSLHAAFGSVFGSALAIAFIFLTGMAPLIAGMNGSYLAWYAYAAVTLTRAMSSIKTGKNGVDAFVHPLSSALLIYLIIYSWLMRGQLQWKGRTL